MERNLPITNTTEELIESIQNGLDAGLVQKFLLPLLSRKQNEIVDKLKNTDPYYQNIDNKEYFVLHLRLKMIEELKSDVKTIVDSGEEAQVRLRSIQMGDTQSLEDDILRRL